MNRVLMIEDNEDDIELARRTFEKAGLPGQVRIVRTGEEALELLLRRGPYAAEKAGTGLRLILLDLNLPKTSGLELLRQLRLHEATREIPIVVLTVSTKEPDLLQCFTMGVTDYLIKPIDAKHFMQIYQKYVAGKLA